MHVDVTKNIPITEHDLARMGIGRQFWRVKLDEIPEKCAYKKAIHMWIDRMPEMLEKGIGLILHGAFRQGKTSAAAICMKALALHGGTAYMIRADHVAGAVVKAEMFDDEETIEQRCRVVDLLVIDDLVQGGGYEQTIAIMERLIRWRYDHRKCLFVTTNAPAGIEKRYGDGTAMVLRSRCHPVKVDGTPFWEKEKNEVAEMFCDRG